jgi:murein DD-endopeptidase MepM/ murein hydrolase activator NlpD
LSSQPSTTSARKAARHRRAHPGRAGALAGRRGLIASVGAALVGFGLAGVSAAAPILSERTSAAGTSAETAKVAGVAARAGAAATARADASATPSAGATAGADAAAAARAEAARRADRSARSTPTPRPTTPSPSRTAKPEPAWVHPLPGAEVTSCYGPRWGTLHAGIDLADPMNTPIRAVGDGAVASAGWVQSGYGISVLIDHGNGYLTHYAHLNREAVRVGETVRAGEVIGYEGSTGDSTGPHLHFEVHRGAWNQIDPAPWMRARGVDLGC